MGRRPKGAVPTIPCPMRLDPQVKEQIEWVYGSVKEFVEAKYKEEFGDKKKARSVPVKAKINFEVTEDDF